MQPARVITQPEPKPQPAPEPFRAGLPALALRRAHARWDQYAGSEYLFSEDGLRYEGTHWGGSGMIPVEKCGPATCMNGFRPHGATWAEVETKAARLLGSENKSIQVSPICPESDCLNWLSLQLGITDPTRDMTALWAAFREGQKS